MRRSTELIPTTHVGSLVRPPDLLDALRAHQRGEVNGARIASGRLWPSRARADA